MPTDRPVVVVDYWEKWTGNEGASRSRPRSSTTSTARSAGTRASTSALVSTSNDRHTRRWSAIAAGVPPDVAGMWDRNQLVQYAVAWTRSRPWRTSAAAPRHRRPARTRRCTGTRCHWDGHLYGLISTPATIALIYNKRTCGTTRRPGAAGRRVRPRPGRRGPWPNWTGTRPPWTCGTPAGTAACGRASCRRRCGICSRCRSGLAGTCGTPAAHRFTLTSPACVAAYDVGPGVQPADGPRRDGRVPESGMGNFDSPQNPFLCGVGGDGAAGAVDGQLHPAPVGRACSA